MNSLKLIFAATTIFFSSPTVFANSSECIIEGNVNLELAKFGRSTQIRGTIEADGKIYDVRWQVLANRIVGGFRDIPINLTYNAPYIQGEINGTEISWFGNGIRPGLTTWNIEQDCILY